MSDRSVDDVEVDSAPAGSRLELGEPSTRFAAISPPGGLGSGRSGALIAAPARRTLELQNVFFSSTFRAKATSSRELFRWEISQSKNIVYPKKRLDQLYLFYSRFLLWFARLNSYLDGRWPRGPKGVSELARRPRPRSIATRAQRERRASKLYRSAAIEAGIRGRGRNPKQSKQPQQESTWFADTWAERGGETRRPY